MSSLSRNSSAKAFGIWSRGKNFRTQKIKMGSRTPLQLKGSLAATLVDKKAIKKIYLKIKVYMCSTTVDVALRNISQETKYYNDPVHQPWLRSYHIPSMFLNLGHFQLRVLKLKKVRIKKGLN